MSFWCVILKFFVSFTPDNLYLREKAAVPELYVALGALEASKAIANGALTVANEVVKGTQYATCKGAVPLFRKGCF